MLPLTKSKEFLRRKSLSEDFQVFAFVFSSFSITIFITLLLKVTATETRQSINTVTKNSHIQIALFENLPAWKKRSEEATMLHLQQSAVMKFAHKFHRWNKFLLVRFLETICMCTYLIPIRCRCQHQYPSSSQFQEKHYTLARIKFYKGTRNLTEPYHLHIYKE